MNKKNNEKRKRKDKEIIESIGRKKVKKKRCQRPPQNIQILIITRERMQFSLSPLTSKMAPQSNKPGPKWYPNAPSMAPWGPPDPPKDTPRDQEGPKSRQVGPVMVLH